MTLAKERGFVVVAGTEGGGWGGNGGLWVGGGDEEGGRMSVWAGFGARETVRRLQLLPLPAVSLLVRAVGLMLVAQQLWDMRFWV